jgi:hypothetical protein
VPEATVRLSATAGTLDAPFGTFSIAFLTMVGLDTLREWNKEKADQALCLFCSIVMQQLIHHGGYLVRLARSCKDTH